MDLLFQSLILSAFTDAIVVWGCAFYSKYLSRIDNSLLGSYTFYVGNVVASLHRIGFLFLCFKLGYCLKQYSILDIRRNRARADLGVGQAGPEPPFCGLLNISALRVQYGIQAFPRFKRPECTRLNLGELQSQKFSWRSMRPKVRRKVRRSQS